jgi:Tfp pilus assembly protein PilF
LTFQTIFMLRPLIPAFTALFCLFTTLAAQAAPFTPANDSDVVERLPLSATDPSARRLQSLRKQLEAKPDDVALRIEIARRYFDLSMAQGDPRYVGYASAALTPLDKAAPTGNPALTASYWQIKGMLQQYSHNFDGALASLDKASVADPKSPDAMAWRAAIHMVQANYAKAQAECDALKPLTTPLFAAGCTQYVRASTGELQSAFDSLNAAVQAEPTASPELMLWELTRLAEMANRLKRFDEADAYFQRAFKLGVTDQFLLGAYADFLLQQKKPEAVITLLADWERSDILLLRLALAGKAANHKKAADWASALRDRFVDAAKRGDRLHEQEAARFELDIENNPKKALTLAANNYKLQKEARDAEVLLRTALANKDAAAAEPALTWLKQSRYEDAHLADLAAALAKLEKSGGAK